MSGVCGDVWYVHVSARNTFNGHWPARWRHNPARFNDSHNVLVMCVVVVEQERLILRTTLSPAVAPDSTDTPASIDACRLKFSQRQPVSACVAADVFKFRCGTCHQKEEATPTIYLYVYIVVVKSILWKHQGGRLVLVCGSCSLALYHATSTTAARGEAPQ